MTRLSKDCFFACRSISNINLPSSLQAILSGAFSDCTSLESIELPSSLKIIGPNAFSVSTLKNIEIPNSIEVFQNAIFLRCSHLVSVKIHAPVRTIGALTFAKCTSLKRIDIPHSIRTIQNHAFSGCSDLVTVHIINSVGNNRESNSNEHYHSWHDNSASVRLPTTIEYISTNAFIGCTVLSKILDIQTIVYMNDIKYAREFLQKSNDSPIALRPYALVRAPTAVQRSTTKLLSNKQLQIRHLSFIFYL